MRTVIIYLKETVASMNNKRLLTYLFLFILLLITNGVWAKTNHLNKKISISVTNVTIDEVLIRISKIGDFNFSYNAEVLNGDSIVTLKVKKVTVEKTLDELFKKTVRYKVVNNHIILLSNTEAKKKERTSKKSSNTAGYTLSGYILDANTGQTLQNATVYEVDGMVSAITNSQGFYMMILPSDRRFNGLSYCRYDYLDSVVFIRPQGSMQLDISLKPRQTEIKKIQTKTTVLEHDLQSRHIVTWFVPDEALLTANNITTGERAKIQFSVLPFIGSNKELSGTKTNNLSINLLAGYTGGVDGVELGSLFNIVHNDVKGVQMAGLGNIVGKETNGVQMAGLFNVNNGSVTGAQIAGFQNTLNGEMHGAQISGFNNVTTQNVDGIQATGFVNITLKDVNKAQLSGFANYGNNIGGLQATGFANIATGNVDKAQLAGFVNVCDSVTGAQVAGFVNVAAKHVKAVQLAGFANYANSVTGVQLAGFSNICSHENLGTQISGFFNYTNTLSGLQLAFINISDTVESGVPIGFFSYVQKGYHVFELSSDEIFYTNLAFKTGVRKFYNIFKFGFGNQNKANLTYGLGFTPTLKNNHSLSFDFTLSSVNDLNNNFELLGAILKFNPAYSYSFHKHFTVFAGPSISAYAAQITNENGEFIDISFNPFYDETFDNTRLQMWAGFTFGVRL